MTTYTPSELTSYLQHIRFPNPTTPPPPTLATLRQLMTHHLATIPFENLSMHYRPSHSPANSRIAPVDISPGASFTKLVPRQGSSSDEQPLTDTTSRGGYCMEVNTVFSTVLRTLGYNLWTIGGRASLGLLTGGKDRSGEFGAWDHMATIVDLSSAPDAAVNGTNGHTEDEEAESGVWMVDVGFGGSGPLHPLPIRDGAVAVGQGTQRQRVIRRRAPPGSKLHPKVDLGWILQTGEVMDPANPEDREKLADAESNLCCAVTTAEDGTTVKWSDGHHFYPFVPFKEKDYVVMSYGTSTHPDAGFHKLLISVRMLREDEITDEERKEMGPEVKGKIVLRDRWLTRKVGERSDEPKELTSEEERVEALKEWFGIVVDRESIRGNLMEITEENLRKWREAEEKEKKEKEKKKEKK